MAKQRVGSGKDRGWYSLLKNCTENRVSCALGAELPPTPVPRLGWSTEQHSGGDCSHLTMVTAC